MTQWWTPSCRACSASVTRVLSRCPRGRSRAPRHGARSRASRCKRYDPGSQRHAHPLDGVFVELTGERQTELVKREPAKQLLVGCKTFQLDIVVHALGVCA